MLEPSALPEVPPAPRPPLAPGPPPRPQVYAVWLAWVLAMGGLFVGSIPVVLIALAQGYPPDKALGAPAVLHLSGLVSGSALLVGVVFAVFLLRDAAGGWRERLALRTERFRVLDAALLSVAMISLGSAIDELLHLAGVNSTLFAQIASTVKGQGPIAFALVFPFMALSPGFFEELFYRGLAQERFVQRHGAPAGIALTSVLFGVMHGDVLHSPVAALLGVLLGWAAWKSRTIVTGMVAHAVNNAVSFTGMRYLDEPSASVRRVTLVVSVALLAATVALLHRRWSAGRSDLQ